MKKREGTWVIIGILICAAFAGGYQLSTYSQVGLEPTVTGPTVIDDLGRSVTIPAHPERIISLSGDITEILYAIGAGSQIVGVDKYSTYPPEVKDKPWVGSSAALNLEVVMDLDPDLVLMWWYQERVIPVLEDVGITVVALDAVSVKDMINKIKFIGLIVGKTSEADNLTSVLENQIEAITDKTEDMPKAERPTIYFESMSPMHTMGLGTFTNELIFMAGAINIAAEGPFRYPILLSEYIIGKNPEIIVVVTRGASVEDIKSRGGWEVIDAVKNDKVYQIDIRWVSANPRIVLGLKQLAEWAHPELFVNEG